MTIKKTFSQKLFDVFNVLLMLGLIAITIYPLLYVLFASISDPKMLLKHEGFLFAPLQPITFQGYKITLSNPNILIGYRNTIFYVVVGTFLNILLTSLGAYAVTRNYFKLRNFLLGIITITMFFSGGLIPMFIIVKGLGIYDTVWAVILPGLISSWNLIIMKTFFQGIPVSLEESALMDGATDWDIFIRVIIPLSKPVIAVMVLYYGVGHWNEWFGPMIYLRDRNLFPLQLFLREILMLNSATGSQAPTAAQMVEQSFFNELLQYCTIVVATVPILFVYPFLQKHFVKGVMIGAIKG